MSKSLILSIVTLAIIAIGGIAYFWSINRNQPQTTFMVSSSEVVIDFQKCQKASQNIILNQNQADNSVTFTIAGRQGDNCLLQLTGVVTDPSDYMPGETRQTSTTTCVVPTNTGIVHLKIDGGAISLYPLRGYCNPSDQDDNSSSVAQNTQTTTVLQLMNEGKNQKCTFYESSPEETSETVTFYVTDQDQVRMDSNEQTNEGPLALHTILTRHDQYTWTDNGDLAYHALIDEQSPFALLNLNLNFSTDGLNCAPWIPDPLKFMPPENIDFAETDLRNK